MCLFNGDSCNVPIYTYVTLVVNKEKWWAQFTSTFPPRLLARLKANFGYKCPAKFRKNPIQFWVAGVAGPDTTGRQRTQVIYCRETKRLLALRIRSTIAVTSPINRHQPHLHQPYKLIACRLILLSPNKGERSCHLITASSSHVILEEEATSAAI